MPTESDKILVSVVIPTHNRSQDLRVAISSVLAQTEQSFEILVMDDASTEDLNPVVSAFDDSRIKLIRNNTKSNAGTMRNLGIQNAAGLYTAFLDSDDEWLPEHLASKVYSIQKYLVDGVYGSAFIFDGLTKTYVNSRSMRSGEHASDYLLNGGAVPTPSWVMSTHSAREILFDEKLSHHEDYDFFVRFANQFKWAALWEPTIIVNWKKGEVRQRNPLSEIQFVQRYFNHLSPKVYFNYHYTQLHYYMQHSSQKSVVAYYRRESLRYVHHLSFFDYCSVMSNKSGIVSFLINWLRYSSLILLRKIKPLGEPVVPFL